MLADWQIDILGQAFIKEKLQIHTMKLELPTSENINWECVATKTAEGAYFPNAEFMVNIEEYRYNRFLNIGR